VKIIDIYSDDVLTIVTNDSTYRYVVGDNISVTMVDGFKADGVIKEINADKVVIETTSGLMKYALEKFSYLHR
jgi:hypothetical protein